MAAVAGLNIDDRIERRLETLCGVLTRGAAKKLRIAPVAFLSALLSEPLRNLKFDRDNDPLSGQSMEIFKSVRQKKYRISHQTREAMELVASNQGLDDQDTDWMIDNYFIHEFLHHAQGMSGGNHSQLRRHAPRVLLDVDYQADALAAFTATALAWLHPSKFGFGRTPVLDENHWTLYERAVSAVLNQMEIFTLLGNWATPRDQISMMPTSLERILRIATWHYQLHRLSTFSTRLPLADFQILAQPVLDFRNLAWAAIFEPDSLCKDWPLRERAVVEKWQKRASLKGRLFDLSGRPQLVLAAATQQGTTRFVRYSAATRTHYYHAFDGIFDNDVGSSRLFFTALFEQHEWLKGGSDSSAFSYNLNLRGKGTDHLQLTNNLGRNLEIKERVEVLKQIMTPSRSQILSAF